MTQKQRSGKRSEIYIDFINQIESVISLPESEGALRKTREQFRSNGNIDLRLAA